MVGTKVEIIKAVVYRDIAVYPGEVYVVSKYNPRSRYPIHIEKNGMILLLDFTEVKPFTAGLFV